MEAPYFLCPPQAAASVSHRTKASSCLQTAVCVMPAYICLCLYVAFCLCFAVTLSLGLFGACPGMHSYFCCLSLLLSVACTKDPFQWMSSGSWWFLQSQTSAMELSPVSCRFCSAEMIKQCSQNTTFFFTNVLNFWNVSTGSTTEFSSVVISPPGQEKTKRPAFGLGANGLICKFSKYWVLQDKEIL